MEVAKRLPGRGENKGLSNMVCPAFSMQREQEEWRGNESKMSIRKCLYKQATEEETTSIHITEVISGENTRKGLHLHRFEYGMKLQ